MSGICDLAVPVSDERQQLVRCIPEKDTGLLATGASSVSTSATDTSPKAEAMSEYVTDSGDQTDSDYENASSKDSSDGHRNVEGTSRTLSTKKKRRKMQKSTRRVDNAGNNRTLTCGTDKVPCTVCGRPFAGRYMTSHMRVHKVNDANVTRRTSPRQASLRSSRVGKEVVANDDDHDEVRGEEEQTSTERRPEVGTGIGVVNHTKVYECYVCDRSFSKTEMPAHMRTHEPEGKQEVKVDNDPDVKPNLSTEDDSDDDEHEERDGKPVARRKLKKFPCDICGKSFDRYYLLEHIRSHARRMSLALAKSSKNHGSPPKSRTSKSASVRNKKKEPVVNNDKSASGDEEEDGDDDDDDEKMGSSTGDCGGSPAADGEDANDVDDTEYKKHEGSDDGSTSSKKNKKKKKSEIKRSRRQRPKLPCDVCGSMFNKYYMVIHLRSHTGEKPFTCGVCDKQFVSASSLSSHNNNCHGEQRGKVQCDICGRLVSSKMSLRQHLRTHSEEKPYQCHVCGKSFKQCAQLSAHVKTHSDGMPYQCEACGHRYKSVTGLIRHREYHHLGIRKKYPCELCGKSFTRHSKLRDHLMWHRGTSPYLCKYCDKRLLSRKTLNSHLLIHKDLKPYKCETCGKRFRQNCVLKRHLTVHTGIKPFHCELCGKQFIHRVYLAKHVCDVQHDGNRTFVVL